MAENNRDINVKAMIHRLAFTLDGRAVSRCSQMGAKMAHSE
jgi:hypothetical protein